MTKTLRLPNRLMVLALALLAIVTERVISYCFGIERLLPGLDGGVLLAWAIGHCDTLDGPVIKLAQGARGGQR